MTARERAVQFVERLQTLYFEQRDLERVPEYLSPDFVLIGTGEEELLAGADAVGAYLAREADSFSSSFTVRKCRYEALDLAGGGALVYGTTTVRENVPTGALSFTLRVSCLLEETAQGLRLRHLHLSYPSEDQGADDFFPGVFTRKQIALLNRVIEQKSAQLEASVRDLEVLTNNIPGGMFRCLFDEELTLLQISDGFLKLLGYTRQQIAQQFHNSFWRMIDPRDRADILERAKRQLEMGGTKELEYRMIRADGQLIWVLDKGQLVRDAQGRDSFCCILIDITRNKQMQEELRLSLERHQIIMGQANDIIFEWDVARDTFSFSGNWDKKYGYQPLTEQVSERLATNTHMHPEDRPLFGALLEAIRLGKHYGEAEVRLRRTEGGYQWARVRMTGLKDSQGSVVKAAGVIVDIDAEKQNALKLLAIAQRDTLTGLYNKGTAQQLIAEYLGGLTPGRQAALMIVDIDDFKGVNDSLGHLFGDAFLIEVAHGVQRHFRAGDVIGRIGGDEFIVYINDVPDAALVEAKARQIVEAFGTIELPEGAQCAITCSIGMALVPEQGSEFEELYRKADHALYRAKAAGKNRFFWYSTEQDMGSLPRSLRSAVGAKIDSDEGSGVTDKLVEQVFRVLYQSADVERAVNSILAMVGRRLDVSRAYIFEDTEDGRYCCNTFEWCNDGVSSEIDNLRKVSYEELGGDYMSNFNEDGIFYCRDVTMLSPEQYAVVAPQGIKSMLQCAIRDNGQIRGYVGFDECRANRFWTQQQVEVLSFIAELLSTFLLKRRAQGRDLRSAEAMRTLLDNQNAWIYVVDPQSLQMLFINQKTAELVPEAHPGMCCYRAFFGYDRPCAHCPARGLSAKKRNQTLEIYNPLLKVWSSADACWISWKGQEAILLTCHDITRFMAERPR